MKRGEPHPSLYEGVLGSPHSLFVLHASKEPDLVGTGWPTVPTLEHGGEETSCYSAWLGGESCFL